MVIVYNFFIAAIFAACYLLSSLSHAIKSLHSYAFKAMACELFSTIQLTHFYEYWTDMAWAKFICVWTKHVCMFVMHRYCGIGSIHCIVFILYTEWKDKHGTFFCGILFSLLSKCVCVFRFLTFLFFLSPEAGNSFSVFWLLIVWIHLMKRHIYK